MKDINIQNLYDDYILETKDIIEFNDNYKYFGKSRIDDVRFVILNKLTEFERRLFLIYLDAGSLRETGKVFKCSYSKIWYKIKEIREKIINELKDL